MKLKSLKLENFFSHKSSFINFDNVESISLLMGTVSGDERDSNGSGKTTIIEAILCALYEKTRLTENKNATLDDMVRWNSNGKMLIEFQFEINNALYKIVRTRDSVKSKGTVTFEVLSGTKWKKLTDAKKALTNKEILKTIGIDYETFCASICFQQKEVDKFISATETQRKAIIKNILQLDRYDDHKASAKAKVQTLDVQLKALEKQLESSQVNILDVEAKEQELEGVEKQLKLIELEKQVVVSQIEKLRKKQIVFNEQATNKISLENQIKDRTFSIDKLESNNKTSIARKLDYEKAYKSKKDEFSKLKEEYDQIKDEFTIEKSDIMKDGKAADRKLKQSESDLESLSAEYHKLKGEVENITRDIENIATLKEAKCPNCYGDITKESKASSVEFLEAHKKFLLTKESQAKNSYSNGKALVVANRKDLDQVKERLQEYAKWAKEKLFLQDQMKTMKESASEAKMIISDSENIIKENTSMIDQYKKELSRLEKEVSEMKIDTAEFDRINKKVEEKDSKLNDIGRLISAAQISKGRLQAEVKQFKELISQVKLLRQEREHLTTEKFYYNYLVKIFGKEIPSLIIENTCFELSEEANKVLRSISSDSINFVTQRPNKDGTMKEVFEIEITRPGVDHPILIDSLSNGQKFRVVFAIRVALSRLLVRRRSSATIDFLFYDECFASLDDKGIDDVIDVFRYLREEFTHQLIITHRTDLKDRFGNNLITVKQDSDGISSVSI